MGPEEATVAKKIKLSVSCGMTCARCHCGTGLVQWKHLKSYFGHILISPAQTLYKDKQHKELSSHSSLLHLAWAQTLFEAVFRALPYKYATVGIRRFGSDSAARRRASRAIATSS